MYELEGVVDSLFRQFQAYLRFMLGCACMCMGAALSKDPNPYSCEM